MSTVYKQQYLDADEDGKAVIEAIGGAHFDYAMQSLIQGLGAGTPSGIRSLAAVLDTTV